VRGDGGGNGDTLPIEAPDGVLVNSGAFDGLSCAEGGKRIVAWLAGRGLGTAGVQ